jgi:hypothetical protein
VFGVVFVVVVFVPVAFPVQLSVSRYLILQHHPHHPLPTLHHSYSYYHSSSLFLLDTQVHCTIEKGDEIFGDFFPDKIFLKFLIPTSDSVPKIIWLFLLEIYVRIVVLRTRIERIYRTDDWPDGVEIKRWKAVRKKGRVSTVLKEKGRWRNNAGIEELRNE